MLHKRINTNMKINEIISENFSGAFASVAMPMKLVFSSTFIKDAS